MHRQDAICRQSLVGSENPVSASGDPRAPGDATARTRLVARYRVHYTHPDGVTTTADYDSERDLGVSDVIVVDGERWQVQEVEPFQIEGYDALLAVVPAADD